MYELLRTTAADLILSQTQDELHYCFYRLTIKFHKNPRLIVSQNLKKCQPPSVTKRLETKKNKFQILKATKFCANSKRWKFSNFPVFTSKILQRFWNYRVLLETAQATHKYLDVLKLKKTPYFFAFAVLRCCKKSKKVFAQADSAFWIGLQNNFKNVVV